MAKIRRFDESGVRREAEPGTNTRGLSSLRTIAGGARFCAYNVTGERFLSNQIEVGSFPTHLLEKRLATFTPGSGGALWINPYRELPLALFRFPVDLVHLDQNGIVLNTFESFPISTSDSTAEMAASVLVLPVRTIASIGIHRGNQLIVCPSDEMELRLAQVQNQDVQVSTGPEIIQNRSVASFARFSVHENLTNEGAGNSIKTQEDLNQTSEGEISWAEETPATPSIDEERTNAQEQEDKPRPTSYKKKSWWRRFLAGEPPDPRTEERESIPGLVAYFFTGGAPIAHKVRNISTTGLYVITDHRWYPNTALRVSLSDERDPSRQVSITLFARVARSGSDGVGMQFGFVRKKDLNPSKSSTIDDQSLTVTKEQMEDFVRRFKAGS
jgi:hypothetical protein